MIGTTTWLGPPWAYGTTWTLAGRRRFRFGGVTYFVPWPPGTIRRVHEAMTWRHAPRLRFPAGQVTIVFRTAKVWTNGPGAERFTGRLARIG
ncbi:MAG: hypothetical protein M3Z75_30005 [Actinomycetota bacterium]|nr:hypothetical protein [Actinomycetota bacterium]